MMMIMMVVIKVMIMMMVNMIIRMMTMVMIMIMTMVMILYRPIVSALAAGSRIEVLYLLERPTGQVHTAQYVHLVAYNSETQGLVRGELQGFFLK